MDEPVYFQKALSFIHSLGIETRFVQLEDKDCFLPGLMLSNGSILVDCNKLAFAGDILHEAAHLAMLPAAERSTTNAADIGKRKDAAAEEMAAIAWTYAACIHLNIDPHFVFHEAGYKGSAASITESFRNGKGVGVPILQWFGMTGTNGNCFPVMTKWTRD